MTQILPRFYRRQLEASDREAIAFAVNEASDGSEESAAGSTKPGDPRKLRGIPVCAMGVRGTSPGTDPVAELLRSAA
jgi:hypothetical protein